MKKWLALWLLIGRCLLSSAQLYDAQWVIGDRESVLDFRNDTLTNYAIGPEMPMFLTSANICDSSGNLLYYTNGIYIAGADGNQIENGDSLSPCASEFQQACCGLDIPQGAMFLPMPGNSRYFYLFHTAEDTVNGNRPGTLYYSVIDKNGNGGAGSVISKNNAYYHGIFREGGMTACKHANGRDWWITWGDIYNTYYTFLVGPDGIRDTIKQTIGPSYYTGIDVGYSKFSQDGSKYATGCYQGPILIMDFDRCTGEFSNPVTITNQDNDVGSLEFSPSGRFLYATNSINLAQFDLSLPNPQQDSVTLYQADSSDQAQMRMLQLAPDGKIYASCFAGGFYLIHAVTSPDLKGDSSMYVDTALMTLTTNSFQFPNMINYNLGPLIGSGCDTIWPVGIKNVGENNLLRLIPNPADKYLYVEMGMQGNYEFDLINETGQVIARKETRQVDIFDTGNLANGVYFIRVVDKATGAEIETRKVVVVH